MSRDDFRSVRKESVSIECGRRKEWMVGGKWRRVNRQFGKNREVIRWTPLLL